MKARPSHHVRVNIFLIFRKMLDLDMVSWITLSTFNQAKEQIV